MYLWVLLSSGSLLGFCRSRILSTVLILNLLLLGSSSEHRKDVISDVRSSGRGGCGSSRSCAGGLLGQGLS